MKWLIKIMRESWWASKLDKLQRDHNDGRGVSCVRDVINDISKGDIEGAKLLAHYNCGIIRNYPEIEKYLRQIKIFT